MRVTKCATKDGSALQDECSLEDIRISLEYHVLEAHRLTKTFKDHNIKCPVSIHLGKALRTSGSALLPFTVSVEAQPDFFSFEVRGNILVEDSEKDVGYWSFSDGDPPRVWYPAYCHISKTILELAQYLGLALPAEFGKS